MGLLHTAASRRDGERHQPESLPPDAPGTEDKLSPPETRRCCQVCDILFDQNDHCLVLIDLEGKIIRSNLEKHNLYDSSLPKTLSEVLIIVHHQHWDELTHGIESLLRGERNRFSFEGESSAEGWIHMEAHLVRDGENGPALVLLSIRDMSEKMKLNRQVAWAETHSAMLLKAIPDVMLRFNHKGILIDSFLPEDFSLLFDQAPELGRVLERLFSPEVSARIREQMDLLRQDGKMKVFSFTIRRRGRLHYFEARLLGMEEGRFFILLRNIDRLRRQMNSLQKSRELFRVTIGSLLDGVIITDRRGCIQEINEPVTSMLGVTAEEALGKPFWSVIHPRTEGWEENRRQLMTRVFQERQTASLEEGIAVVSPQGDIRVLTLYYSPIERDEKELLWGGVLILRDVTSQYDWKNKVKFLSFHDRLTGLYNRAFFDEEMRRIEREAVSPLSLINMDMNGLKLANDGFGHEEGDRLLKKLAAVLQSVCRRDDVVARCGGDEFSVILPGATEEVTRVIVGRIREKTEELNREEGVVPLSFAVGWATLREGESPADMISRADEAMYKDKLDNRQAFRDRVYDTFRKSLVRWQFKSLERMTAFVELSRRFGDYLDLDEVMVERLEQLSLFGVIGVLEQGNLSVDLFSEESREARERCAVVGYRVALTLPQLAPLADEILARFERWDGKGVPRGIAGDEIPLLSRVVRVVAAYFFSPSDQDGAELLRDRAGTLLDPYLAERFIGFLEDQEDILRFDAYEEEPPRT